MSLSLRKMKKPPLLILTGPTAVGKTELSLALAKALSGEIISADSMQVYRGMDIGTAKIRPEERRGIPHHLIDILDPEEDFDVYAFQKAAKEAIAGIQKRGHLPILAGGTGFYIQAVLRDIDFSESPGSSRLRRELTDELNEKGADALYDELRLVDPDSARIIHPHNQKRLIRALEFYRSTGTTISSHNARQRQKASPYQAYYFVLTLDRPLLYERINARVDEMIRQGLREEAAEFIVRRRLPDTKTAMKALGYREWYAYFAGRASMEETVWKIKQDTRHFAKRQLTWFRREENVIGLSWEDFDFDEEKILQFMLEKIKK